LKNTSYQTAFLLSLVDNVEKYGYRSPVKYRIFVLVEIDTISVQRYFIITDDYPVEGSRFKNITRHG